MKVYIFNLTKSYRHWFVFRVEVFIGYDIIAAQSHEEAVKLFEHNHYPSSVTYHYDEVTWLPYFADHTEARELLNFWRHSPYDN